MIRKPLAALARLNLSGPIIVLWGWPRLAVALLAGALSALAFAPFHLFPVLWLMGWTAPPDGIDCAMLVL